MVQRKLGHSDFLTLKLILGYSHRANPHFTVPERDVHLSQDGFLTYILHGSKPSRPWLFASFTHLICPRPI